LTDKARGGSEVTHRRAAALKEAGIESSLLSPDTADSLTH
jgi:hypothetical protein